MVVVRDLELRRKAERAEALRTSEERLRVMVEHGSDMILVLDTDGRIREASESVERLFQFKLRWMYGEIIYDHLHPEDQSAAREAVRSILAEPDRSAQREFRVRRRDGSYAAVDIIGKNLTDHPLIGGIVINARDVTERRAIEDALRRSERDYRGVFENAHDPILIIDPDTEIVYDANQRACEVYGLEREQLVGISLRSITADVARGRSQIELLLAGGRITGFESIQYRFDGSPMHLEINASLVEYQGRPAVLSINRDVTERHTAELELRRSHERLAMVSKVWRAVTLADSTAEVARRALEAAATLIPFDCAAVLTLDPQADGARILATTGQDDIGPSGAEVTRHVDWDALCTTDQPVITHRAGAASVPGSRWLYDLDDRIASTICCGLRRDDVAVGAVIFLATASDRFDTHHLLAVRDLVNPLTAALQAISLRAEVEQHSQRLTRLVDRLPEGVALLGSDNRLEISNATAFRLLQLLSGAGLEDSLTMIAGEPIDEVLHRACGPTPLRLTAPGDDSERIVELSATTLDGGGDSQGHIVLLRDISRDVERQRKLEQQDRLAAVGQLAAGIAHDFNNMLQAISGFAELIQLDTNAPESVLEMARGLRVQTQRGAQLVRQILDFSRKSASERRPMNLDVLANESIDMLHRTIPESIRIVTEVEPAEYSVLGDPTQLQQVITNLAVNARDAMPDGGELRIGLSRYRLDPDATRPDPRMPDGEWIRLTITDTGTGVDPEVRSRLFEPFVTTKAPGEGTGLGLAQAYGIVTRHGGHLGFTTAPKRGSTFSVYLPPHVDAQDEVETEVARDLVNGAHRRVLLIEDAPLVRAATLKMLQTLGFDAQAAVDGEQALDLLLREDYRFDLILSDVVMPGIGGTELRQRLLSRGVDIPTIFMSGFALGGQDRDITASDAVSWLEKPFSAERLSEALRRHLSIGVPTGSSHAHQAELAEDPDASEASGS